MKDLTVFLLKMCIKNMLYQPFKVVHSKYNGYSLHKQL